MLFVRKATSERFEDMPETKENAPEVKEFMSAVRRSDLDVVDASLRGSPQLVHSYDYDCFGARAIIHAANACNREMVDLLLKHGADINARSDWWAGSFGVLPNDDRGMAEFLIERGATVDAHTVAHMGMTQRLRDMLNADPELVHARAGDGQFPLHYAGTTETVDLLLERGADIEGRDIDHESTPAQWQATRNTAMTRYLIERGAERDVFMITAIGAVDLLRNMLDENPRLPQGRISIERFHTSDDTEAHHIYMYTMGDQATPLHVAAGKGRIEAAKLLLEAGADPNAAGGYDRATPLHQAAWNNRVAFAELLLDHGADLNRCSGEIHDNEPVGWAAVAGAVDMVHLLVTRGATVRKVHVKDAEAGAQGRINYTNAPAEAFQKIAEMLRGHLG